MQDQPVASNEIWDGSMPRPRSKLGLCDLETVYRGLGACRPSRL